MNTPTVCRTAVSGPEAAHCHEAFVLILLLSGEATLTLEGRMFHCQAGELLLTAPGQPHRLEGSWEGYVLRASWEPEALPAGRFPLTAAERLRVLELLEALEAEGRSRAYGAEAMTQALLTQLRITLCRLVPPPARGREPGKNGLAVEQVMAYIDRHYSEDLTLELLAERFFVSKYHLSREFHRRMGISISACIQKRRLRAAGQLLAQGRKPSQVYLQCGFGDYTSFYRAFRREWGLSPREYGRRAEKSTGL